jgi:mannosyltransferase
VRVRPASLLILAVLAAAVRVPGVYTQAFWQDEVASARILSLGSIPAVLARVARTESTPPLWYVLGWSAHRAGLALRDVRLVSVAAGVLLALATAVLARRFVDETPALLAGLLVALGEQFVAHGQELRAYELFALLVVLFALALLAEVERPSLLGELRLGLATAAGALTHYFFVPSAAAAVVWLWLDPAARRARVRASTAVATGALTTVWWAPNALRQVRQDRYWWIGPFDPRQVVAAPLRLFTLALNGTTSGLVLSVFALGLVGVGVHAARRSPTGRLAAALALLPLAVAGGAWAAGIRIFALRNLIGVGPFVAVTAAAAVAGLPRRALATAASGALVAALGASLLISEVGEVPPYDVMARALIADGWTPSIPIAVYGNPLTYRGPLEWYLPRKPVLTLARPRPGGCRVVLVVTPSGRVVRRRVDGRLRGATLLGEAHDLPRCVRALPVHHAALA